jgi:ferredoxin
MMFHIGRAMHMAGRCVECGACEAACASGVNLGYIQEALGAFIKTQYGFRAGMDSEAAPALASYKIEDAQTGFFEGAGL